MQFRAICSKGNQKLTLSLSANSIDEARSILHGQGYSIMEIQESSQASMTQESGNDNFFFFDAIINGQQKSGKIQSEDVFKAYKKLIEDLGYNITYIYTTEGMNEEQKKVITAKVRDGYMLYQQSIGIDTSIKKNQSEREVDMAEISPQVLKEISHYNTIIDSTIEKIQNLFLKYHNTISHEKRSELENIEATLAQSKGLSNLGKLKTIVENALMVIGNLESELIKTDIDGDKKKISDETNSLLKQIGSSSRIANEKDIDIGKSITGFLNSFQKKTEVKVEQKKKVDTNSFIFYKNLRELNTYKENLNAVEIEILKSIVKFQFSKIKRLLLKKKLLEQDIQIIDNRIHNKNISYTKIVKGTKYYSDIFFTIFQKIGDIIFYSLLLYSITYVFLISLKAFGFVNVSFQPQFFLYITIFSLIAFLFSFFRSLSGFIIGSILFFVSFLFLSINF
ncbi:hypothetical protein KBB25_00840 [Candidatus Gracilibacteria bacterium]|nr:hypothetical protein [Candidatus Gracilibacteria bacterium]